MDFYEFMKQSEQRKVDALVKHLEAEEKKWDCELQILKEKWEVEKAALNKQTN